MPMHQRRKRLLFRLKWACLIATIVATIPITVMADTLTVAFAHWPPRKVMDGGPADGIDARLLSVLAKRLGFKVVYVECPWPRCIEMIKRGEADLITSFGKNALVRVPSGRLVFLRQMMTR